MSSNAQLLREHADKLRAIADALDNDAAELEQRESVLIAVKIVTKGGGMTAKSYSYRHSSELPAGTMVVVPSTQRWQEPISYAVVQGPGQLDQDISWYDAIERVVA